MPDCPTFCLHVTCRLVANPRILVGLFKYRHLLAGFYRSAHSDMKYFVLGVPARDDSKVNHLKTFHAGWTVKHEYGDMTGYWLVYINLRSGEFVKNEWSSKHARVIKEENECAISFGIANFLWHCSQKWYDSIYEIDERWSLSGWCRTDIQQPPQHNRCVCF